MQFLIDNIINQLRDVQDGKNWMGPNFKERLANITEDSTFVRPIPNLHSIAEIISHLTIWRKDAILKSGRERVELRTIVKKISCTTIN